MPAEPGYQLCTRCVMDTTDPTITFDESGMCSHCHHFDTYAKTIWSPTPEGRSQLDSIMASIKKKNIAKPYDCILGLSGGIDSSYLALVLKQYKMRVLAVHVDGGWNSELAVNNIQTVIEHCGFDLHTHVVDWECMRELQLAYFRSGVSNLDVPQDHAFFAVLHAEALANRCNVFMSGGNAATELCFPADWHGDAMDKINLLDIFQKHGTGPLEHYPTISWIDWFILFKLRGFVQVRPLNYMPYSISQAIRELELIGWRAYPRKHGESIFTKFFQNYFLPTRFGFDKRRPHLSSRIHSGDLSRAEALRLLELPLYEDNELKHDKAYVAKKLSISVQELDAFLTLPKRSYHEYRNWDFRVAMLRALYAPVKLIRQLKSR